MNDVRTYVSRMQINKLTVDNIINEFTGHSSNEYYPVRKPPENILKKFNTITVLHKRNNYFWDISREFKRIVLRVSSERANRYGEHFEVSTALSDKNLLEDLDVVADTMIKYLEFSLTEVYE